jgi:hypothetical protein
MRAYLFVDLGISEPLKADNVKSAFFIVNIKGGSC